ncbi:MULTISPECIES: hypothetical protein [Caproicibacterium]|uniref:Uncharacterized protein n=1 Tax=Caproicibacterium argilliputei TaxID=3030016 RepID=A0AA97DA97_9FIRM|nr:hypothetical protein [Caproicibacterium argilliputei]WOC31701.1 hypothetical protein PXC00_10885 [Caproicibacterium argilliputei]
MWTKPAAGGVRGEAPAGGVLKFTERAFLSFTVCVNVKAVLRTGYFPPFFAKAAGKSPRAVCAGKPPLAVC